MTCFLGFKLARLHISKTCHGRLVFYVRLHCTGLCLVILHLCAFLCHRFSYFWFVICFFFFCYQISEVLLLYLSIIYALSQGRLDILVNYFYFQQVSAAEGSSIRFKALAMERNVFMCLTCLRFFFCCYFPWASRLALLDDFLNVFLCFELLRFCRNFSYNIGIHVLFVFITVKVSFRCHFRTTFHIF